MHVTPRRSPGLRSLLLPALLLVACGTPPEDPTSEASPTLPGTSDAPSTAPASCSALAGLSTRTGDLPAYLARAPITASGSEGFVEPQGVQLVAFERAFARLAQEPGSASAAADLAALGFQVSGYVHAGTPFVLVEDGRTGRGGGTFVLNLRPARELWLEAPHADSDQDTLEQSSRLLTALGARALVVTGANRCASAARTPCSGTSAMCGGALRVSDAAHYDRNYFTAAHRALRAAFPEALAISVHGMDTAGAEGAVISDGTRATASSGSLSLALRSALNRELVARGALKRAYSCNDPSDSGYRALCGTTNVQGRFDNGTADACSASASAPRGRFLHMEQGPELRSWGASADENPVARALAAVVPCTLDGAGLGCTGSSAVPGC